MKMRNELKRIYHDHSIPISDVIGTYSSLIVHIENAYASFIQIPYLKQTEKIVFLNLECMILQKKQQQKTNKQTNKKEKKKKKKKEKDNNNNKQTKKTKQKKKKNNNKKTKTKTNKKNKKKQKHTHKKNPDNYLIRQGTLKKRDAFTNASNEHAQPFSSSLSEAFSSSIYCVSELRRLIADAQVSLNLRCSPM